MFRVPRDVETLEASALLWLLSLSLMQGYKSSPGGSMPGYKCQAEKVQGFFRGVGSRFQG